jgi:hypothetical protein
MTQVVKVAKIGKSADSTDPNDFIFHSDYNTFKIISEGTKVVSLTASTNNQSFTQAHGLEFIIPLVSAFAKRTGVNQVFLPNGVDIETYGSTIGFDGDITFNYVTTDSANITFNFDNAKISAVEVTIKYYLLEQV